MVPAAKIANKVAAQVHPENVVAICRSMPRNLAQGAGWDKLLEHIGGSRILSATVNE